MWIDKKQKLKASYYRSFLALIVIPILLIIMISILIIRTMMMDSAILNIRRAQDNIVSTLGSEVKDVSLRLSHFVYVNGNEIMRNAAKTNTNDLKDKYHYTEILTESFNYAMVPIQDIVSAIFYMKDGDQTYMKDDPILTKEEISGSDWYQQALNEPNIVKVGFYNRSVTKSTRSAHSLTLVAALSPGIDVDRDNVVEMVALFVSSSTGKLIKEYNKEKILGSTMLMDQNGNTIFESENTKALMPDRVEIWKHSESQHKIDGKNYVYVVTEEPVSGLKVVSVVAAETLTKEFNRTAGVIVMVTIVLFSLFYFFSSYFLRNIIEPIHNTVEGMKKVEGGNLEVHIDPKGQAELRGMTHSFNRMTRRLKQLMTENEEQQKKKHQAEIRALQSQINPHFLVNSLNSIRFIAQVSKYEAIAKMAEALIKILSSSFRSSAGFYTLKEELEVLDGFIYLMKIRYSDSFDIQYHISEDTNSCLVPRLILQPIVENSIVHGFSGNEEEIGKIIVSAYREKGFLHLIIEDNGKGMTEDEIRRILEGGEMGEDDHTSIGISNVNTRLVLNYGEDCGLALESEKGRFTRTSIRIPIEEKEK